MDVLGLTFEEVCDTLQPRPHQLKPLRDQYRRLHTGRPVTADALRAAALPIVATVGDGALTKFIQRTDDELEIESVLVPMRRRGRAWHTLCVSSQVGCAHACAFCQTGRLGLVRNLTAAEIVGQVVAAQRDLGAAIRNVVFMGMGEPLDNFENVTHAIRILLDRDGLSFAQERIRLSTVGRTAGIRRLARLGWRRMDLAVSLNAPNDAVRSRIMPVNRLEPMATLRDALLDYPLRNCQYFMIEYVLIPGVNDEPDHAAELVEFLRPLRCIVNVIPLNPPAGVPWPAPDEEAVARFVAAVRERGQPCKPRISKGRPCAAGCGQLGNQRLRPAPPSADDTT
jgi:23S rRNA (adenine2503-C2)-methyltransferase